VHYNALLCRGLLADLTLRVPRRRRWWAVLPGVDQAGARTIEAFFADHPSLTERARALVALETQQSPLAPWEQLRIPARLDVSQGRFCAPRDACLLNAANDYEAVQAWLALHESVDTQRADRKDAERLMLWAIGGRQLALSSLTTEDAIAYLRHGCEYSIGPAEQYAISQFSPETNE
jgi:hypothetical protein